MRLARRLEEERSVTLKQHGPIFIFQVQVCRPRPVPVTIRLEQEVASIPQRSLNQVTEPELHLIGTRRVRVPKKAITQRQPARLGTHFKRRARSKQVLTSSERLDEGVVTQMPSY